LQWRVTLRGVQTQRDYTARLDFSLKMQARVVRIFLFGVLVYQILPLFSLLLCLLPPPVAIDIDAAAADRFLL
jgi:hypothetical protein